MYMLRIYLVAKLKPILTAFGIVVDFNIIEVSSKEKFLRCVYQLYSFIFLSKSLNWVFLIVVGNDIPESSLAPNRENLISVYDTDSLNR